MIILGIIKTNGVISCTDAVISSDISTYDGSAPFSGSTLSMATISDFSKHKTYLGAYTDASGTWHNLISVRHRNGSGDGTSYGMYIRAALTSTDSLKWGQQMNGSWSAERVILDSSNYKSYCTLANIGVAASSHTHTKSQITDFTHTHTKAQISDWSHNHQGEALWPQTIELGYGSSSHGGYIDFHFKGSTADYTSRIIEDASGRINLSGTYFYKSNKQVTLNGPLFINSNIYGSTLPTGSANQIFFVTV